MSATRPAGKGPPRPSSPRLHRRDRLLAWLVTGPVGRLAAFFADLAAAWWRWVRRSEPPAGSR